MGQTRLIAIGVGALLVAVAACTAGSRTGLAAPSRFVSYDSEGDCLAGRILTPAVCRSAFASARSEFEAKTAAFGSLAQCTKVYGSCAAWPPGTASRSSFRPQWGGIDIVDTPTEKSVTPSISGGSKRVRFAARPLAGDEAVRELVVRGGRRLAPAPVGAPQRAVRGARRSEPDAASPGASGGGFTMQNGVLSFPAPARFAPRALPKTP